MTGQKPFVEQARSDFAAMQMLELQHCCSMGCVAEIELDTIARARLEFAKLPS